MFSLMFEIRVVVWPGKFCGSLREGLRECTFEVGLIPHFVPALCRSLLSTSPALTSYETNSGSTREEQPYKFFSASEHHDLATSYASTAYGA